MYNVTSVQDSRQSLVSPKAETDGAALIGRTKDFSTSSPNTRIYTAGAEDLIILPTIL